MANICSKKLGWQTNIPSLTRSPHHQHTRPQYYWYCQYTQLNIKLGRVCMLLKFDKSRYTRPYQRGTPDPKISYTRLPQNRVHQTAPKQSTPDCPKTVHQTLKNRHTWPKNCLMIASSNEPKILWVRFGIHVCIMNTIITWKPDWKCPHYHLLCF